MSNVVAFENREALHDFNKFVQRLHRFGLPDLRFVAHSNVLSVFGSVQAPAGLLDTTPTVMVLRSFRLGESISEHLDRVVPVRSFLDRIAHLSDDATTFELPVTESFASWAGVLPPVSGWQFQYTVDAQSLRQVAQQGMAQVVDEMPSDAGDAIARKIRSRVWGTEIAPGLQGIVAYSAETMGFLANAQPLTVARAHSWLRVSSIHGDVIMRQELT